MHEWCVPPETQEITPKTVYRQGGYRLAKRTIALILLLVSLFVLGVFTVNLTLVCTINSTDELSPKNTDGMDAMTVLVSPSNVTNHTQFFISSEKLKSLAARIVAPWQNFTIMSMILVRWGIIDLPHAKNISPKQFRISIFRYLSNSLFYVILKQYVHVRQKTIDKGQSTCHALLEPVNHRSDARQGCLH